MIVEKICSVAPTETCPAAAGGRHDHWMVRRTRRWASNYFNARKEVKDFVRGGLGRVGAVYGVVLNAGGKKFSDGSRSGFGGVCGAHHLAQPGNDVIALEHHHERGPGAHEGRQAFKKWPAAVDLVKTLRFLFGKI